MHSKRGRPKNLNPDMIWIVEAASEYGRSRDWLDRQADAGKLNRYNIPGDRRTYLSRKELDAFLQPRPKD